MRYSVVLARSVYEELYELLDGHVEVMPYTMGSNVVLRVDERGRSVIEKWLPGRMNWDAHQIPEARR